MKIVSRPHCRYALGYHFAFVTKRRKGIFRGWVEAALKRILSEVCFDCGYEMELAGVDRDHVHVFVSAAPTINPSEIARRIKGGSLWSPSFFVSSVGEISEGAVRRYTAAQGAAS